MADSYSEYATTCLRLKIILAHVHNMRVLRAYVRTNGVGVVAIGGGLNISHAIIAVTMQCGVRMYVLCTDVPRPLHASIVLISCMRYAALGDILECYPIHMYLAHYTVM